MIKLILFILTFCLGTLHAKTTLMDVEWKKIELEKVISERIRNLLMNASVEGVSSVDVQILLDKDGLAKVNSDKKTGIRFSGNSSITPIVKFDLENEIIESGKNTPAPEVDIDFYKFIKSLEVGVYIDSKTPQDKKDIVLSFLKKNFPNYSGVEITYALKDAISTPEKPVYLNPRNQDYALYVMLVILGISALIVASRILFKGFQSVASSFDRINDGMHAARMKEEEQKSSESVSLEKTKVSLKKYEGLKKYKELLDQKPEEASSILKGWLNAEGALEKTSIYMITRYLGIEDLQKVYKFMNHRFRYRLGNFKYNPKEADFLLADSFLQDQLSSFVLLGERLKDSRLKCLVLESSDQVIKKIVETNSEAGAYLLSLLSPAHASRIVKELKETSFMKIMSTVVEPELPQSLTGFLVDHLSRFNEPLNRRLPLIFENIEEHLQQSSPEREKAIFKMAIDYLDKDQLIEIGLKFFPVYLCHHLSSQSKFMIIIKMTPTDKLNFLVIQEENSRGSLLELIGKPGSKARDVLEVDLQRILNNQELVSEIKSKTDKIWYTFAQTTRRILITNSNVNKDAHEILSSWIDDHNQRNADDSAPMAA